ncbi:MAG: hypothetical protein RBT61_09360, partial [Candidatus Kapabacteria bacterium]|nr:hypothetical protein [Candidatus Kapabacteria bacterium]
MKLISAGCILFIILFSMSCIEENPDLVNPPDNTGSIKFRFLNLGLDKQAKSLEILVGKKTNETSWGMLSNSDNPPADTGFVRIMNDNVIEFEQTLMQRFIRNTNYTYIGLSSVVCENRNDCKIDTLISLRTTSSIPENDYECLVKFMNAYPDTNIRFSIRAGCPGGDVLFSQNNYKQYSINPITVRSGQFNFSVIKSVTTIEGIEHIPLNLYSVDFQARGQYVIIAHEDDNGNPTVSILDENDLSENGFKAAEVVPVRTTEIRTINLSESNLNLTMKDGTIIDDNVAPVSIDNYMTIEACKSSTLDSIEIFADNVFKSEITKSLEVLSRYTIVVFDSADVKAGNSVLVEPLKLNVHTEGKALIRVINTLSDYDGINVSIGARKEENREEYLTGFSSGIVLARRLESAMTGQPVVINPGPAPISVFTSDEPSRLLVASNTTLEENKSYLVIVTKDATGNIKLLMIEEEEENTAIEYIKPGVFFQLVNATSDNSSLKVSIKSEQTGTDILSDADLHVTNSLATVIDQNNQTIIVNGMDFLTSATNNERVMMGVGGTAESLESVVSNFPP